MLLFIGIEQIRSTLFFLCTNPNKAIDKITGIIYNPMITGIDASPNDTTVGLITFLVINTKINPVNIGTNRVIRIINPLDFFMFSIIYLKLINDIWEFIT